MSLVASTIDNRWKTAFGDQKRPELYTSDTPDEDGFHPLNDAQLFTPDDADYTADQLYAITANNQIALKLAQDEYFELQDAINALQGKESAKNPQDLASKATFEAIKESKLYSYKYERSKPAFLNVDGDRIRKETVSEQEKADVQLYQEPFEQGGFVPTDRQYKQALAKAKDPRNPDGWKPVEKGDKRLIPRKQTHHDEYVYRRPGRLLDAIQADEARPQTAGSLDSALTPSKPPTDKRVFRTRFGGQKIPPTREVSEAPSVTSTPRRRGTPKAQHIPVVHPPPPDLPEGSPQPKRRKINGYDSPRFQVHAETANGLTHKQVNGLANGPVNGPASWAVPPPPHSLPPPPPPPAQPQMNGYYHHRPPLHTPPHRSHSTHQYTANAPPIDQHHPNLPHNFTSHSQNQHQLHQSNQLPQPPRHPSASASSTASTRQPTSYPPPSQSPLYPNYVSSMRSRKWTNEDLLVALAVDHSWLDPGNPKEAARKRAGLEKSQNPVRSLSMYLKWQFWDREGMNKRPRRADGSTLAAGPGPEGGQGVGKKTPTPASTPVAPVSMNTGPRAGDGTQSQPSTNAPSQKQPQPVQHHSQQPPLNPHSPPPPLSTPTLAALSTHAQRISSWWVEGGLVMRQTPYGRFAPEDWQTQLHDKIVRTAGVVPRILVEAGVPGAAEAERIRREGLRAAADRAGAGENGATTTTTTTTTYPAAGKKGTGMGTPAAFSTPARVTGVGSGANGHLASHQPSAPAAAVATVPPGPASTPAHLDSGSPPASPTAAAQRIRDAKQAGGDGRQMRKEVKEEHQQQYQEGKRPYPPPPKQVEWSIISGPEARGAAKGKGQGGWNGTPGWRR